jgi:hypothetical protein
MKKFSCSTLAVMMRCIENAGFWDRLFLSAIVNSDRFLGMREAIDRAVPKPKKPGFFEPLCLDTDILCKNPVSHQSAIGLNQRNNAIASLPKTQPP